jgi:sarcosine oxidase subunit beta
MAVDHTKQEIIVVGGGVIGCSIAYHLASRGASVTLLEQRAIASAASGSSAGGVRQQGRDLRELPIAIQAIARWEHLERELDADLHYYREGHVQVMEDEKAMPEVEMRVAAQRELGLDIQIVRGDDLKELVPGVAEHVVAGTYSANDGHANPILTTHAFANAAKRVGATILTGTRVTALVREGGRITGVKTTNGDFSCDWLVLAAGLWSPGLARQLEIDLPIEGFAPQMIATRPMPPKLRQVVGALTRRLSLKQLPSGNYVIGGGWPGDIDLDAGVGFANLESMMGSIGDSSAIYPELTKAAVERVWVGVEALTVDEVPILGPLPGTDNITVAAGFSGHGFALSPMIGQLISESIIDGSPSLSINELHFTRFVGKEHEEWLPTRRAG